MASYSTATSFNTVQVLGEKGELVAIPGGCLVSSESWYAKAASWIPFYDRESATQESYKLLRRELSIMTGALDDNVAKVWDFLMNRGRMGEGSDPKILIKIQGINQFLCFWKRYLDDPQVDLLKINKELEKQLGSESWFSIGLLDLKDKDFERMELVSEMYELFERYDSFPIDTFIALAKGEKLEGDSELRLRHFVKRILDLQNSHRQRLQSRNPMGWFSLDPIFNLNEFHRLTWRLVENVGEDPVLFLCCFNAYVHKMAKEWKLDNPLWRNPATYPGVLTKAMELKGLKGETYYLGDLQQTRVGGDRVFQVLSKEGDIVKGAQIIRVANPATGAEAYLRSQDDSDAERVDDLLDGGWFCFKKG